MHTPIFCRKRLTRLLTMTATVFVCSFWLGTPAIAQTTTPIPRPTESGAAQPANSPVGTRPAEPARVLQQLNSAIEELTARISPAVVQVLVTGYGPLEQGHQAQTALVGREQAIGSGVIVDSHGYIITNAHVVEGAQKIHVALPLPMPQSSEQIVPVGKERLVEAHLVGLHRDSDLALLKIDQTGLPDPRTRQRAPGASGRTCVRRRQSRGLAKFRDHGRSTFSGKASGP